MTRSVVLLTILGATFMPATAAAERTETSYRGDSAQIWFEVDDGCRSFSIGLQGHEQATRLEAGPAETFDAVAVNVSGNNRCTGAYLSFDAWLEDGFDGGLPSATMDGTVDVSEMAYWPNPETGWWEWQEIATVTVDFHADVSCDGPIGHGVNMSHFMWGTNQRAHTRSVGAFCTAAGTLDVDVDGESFEVESYGSISRTNSGEMYVY